MNNGEFILDGWTESHLIAYDRFMIESQVYYNQLAFIFSNAKVVYFVTNVGSDEGMKVILEPETQKLVDTIYGMIEDLRVSINKRYL